MFDSKTRKNFAFYFAFHIARYAFPLIVTPFLAHMLTKDGFGQFAVINSCFWSTAIFMDFGFYIYGVNRVARSENMEDVSREASHIISAKITLIPLFLIAYGILIVVSGQFYRTPVAAILGAFCGVGIGGSMAWYFQGRQRGGTAVMIESIPQIMQIGLFLSLVRSPHDVWLVILIQSISPWLSIVLSIVLGHREGLRIRLHSLWGNEIRNALSGAMPFFIERLCYSWYTAVTPTVVVLLSSVPEAGIYSVADKAMMFLGTLPGPISQTMMPVLSRFAKVDPRGWRMPLTIVAAMMAFCTLASAVGAVAVGYVITWFFPATYAAAIPTAQIFCIAALLSSLSIGVSNFILVPRDAARIMIWSAISALCVSGILQYTLIPHMGAMGAAWARTGAEGVTALILTTRAVMLFRASRKRQMLEVYG